MPITLKYQPLLGMALDCLHEAVLVCVFVERNMQLRLIGEAHSGHLDAVRSKVRKSVSQSGHKIFLFVIFSIGQTARIIQNEANVSLATYESKMYPLGL